MAWNACTLHRNDNSTINQSGNFPNTNKEESTRSAKRMLIGLTGMERIGVEYWRDILPGIVRGDAKNL